MPSPLWARNCDNRSILSGGWGAWAKAWWEVATFHQPLILIDAFSNLIFVIVFTVHFLRDHPKSGPPPAEAPPKHSCPYPQIYTAVRGIFVLISASWHRNLTSMVSLVTLNSMSWSQLPTIRVVGGRFENQNISSKLYAGYQASCSYAIYWSKTLTVAKKKRFSVINYL